MKVKPQFLLRMKSAKRKSTSLSGGTFFNVVSILNYLQIFYYLLVSTSSKLEVQCGHLVAFI